MFASIINVAFTLNYSDEKEKKDDTYKSEMSSNHNHDNSVTMWVGRIIPYHVYTIEKDYITFVNEEENKKEIMENLGVQIGEVVEINHILFEILENYDLKVVEILKKPAREITTDFNMGPDWNWENSRRKIGEVVDYQIVRDGIHTEEDKRHFMDTHGMAPGDTIEMGCYIYKILDNYQMEVVDIMDIEVDDLMTDRPPVQSPIPSTQGELPYNGRYFIENSIYTTHYFTKKDGNMQVHFLPKGWNHNVEITMYSFEDKKELKNINLDMTELAVYGLFYIENIKEPFYFQIKNNDTNDSINGSYSIQ